MALTAELAAVTRAGWKKEEQDASKTIAPTYGYFVPKAEKIESGMPPDIVIRYADTGVDYPAEFGSMDVAHYDTRTSLVATDTAHYHTPVTVSHEEDMKTRGNKWARERMFTMKRRDAAKSGVKSVNADLVVGIAQTSWPGTRRMTGFRQAIGTSAYFNIPATTSWFTPQTDTTTTIASLSIHNAVSALITKILQQEGNPTVGICSGTVWDKLQEEAGARERVIVGEKGIKSAYFGAETIVVRNCMIWHDPACASSTPYDLFIITPDAVYLDYYSTGEFWHDTGERTPVNSEIATVNMHAYPLLRIGNMRQMGKFTSGTTGMT